MLIAVIPVKDYQTAVSQINLAQEKADGIELRLDYLPQLDLEALAILRQSVTVPVIFTLRSQSQGGMYQKTLPQYLDDLEALCRLEPDWRL